MSRQVLRLAAALTTGVLGASMILAGCGGDDGTTATGGAGSGCDGTIDGTQTLTAWFHTGQGNERDAFQSAVDRFNDSQDQVTIEPVFIPEGTYNEQVKAAAASGDLPDILDFDGPNLYNYAWNGNLQPLDACLPAELKSDLLPSITVQGTYDDKLYGIGTLESGLGLYIRPSAFEAAGVRIPTGVSDAWTAQEFTAALPKLRAAGFDKPLDLQINGDQGEWYAYGFAPVIQSAGADLVDRTDYQSADGVINSPAAVDALNLVKGWFAERYVDFNTDDAAFVNGRSAISWVGHWKYADYSAKWGEDLAIVPLPDFGSGARTGEGSWQWGVTTTANDTDAAWSFISTLFADEYQQQVAVSGSIPAVQSVLDTTPQFAPGGPERLYIDQLSGGVAQPRPATPAYPTISLAYNKVIATVRDGGDVEAALDEAAQTIDADISDNEGYPPRS